MKITIEQNKSIGINGLDIYINDQKYSLNLNLRYNYDMSNQNNLFNIKELILISYEELVLNKRTPKEIANIENTNLFSVNFFMIIGFFLFNDLFNKYFLQLIQKHISLYNFDFNDFFINLTHRRWVYIENEDKQQYIITSHIKKLFKKEVEREKKNSDCFICKHKDFTPERHIWDIAYKNKIHKKISFNIPNKSVREVVYNKQKFNKLLQKIEYSLTEKKSLVDIENDIKIIILVIILIVLFFLDDFKKLIQYNINNMINDVEIITISNLKKRIFKNHSNKTILYIISINRRNNTARAHYSYPLYREFANVFYDKVEISYKKQVQLRDTTHKKQVNSSSIIWKYMKITSSNKIHINTLDFTPFIGIGFYYEIREYIKWHVLADKDPKSILYKVIIFITFLKTLFKEKNICSYDINYDIMKNFSLYLMSSNVLDKELSVSTRQDIFITVKRFLQFIIDNKVSEKYSLKQLETNPAHDIQFLGVDRQKISYQPLPENIYHQIISHSKYLNPIIKNAFIVLSATGLRWSELIGLKKDCLFKRKDIWFIKAEEYKTKNLKLKKGVSTFRKIPIYDENVIKVIEEQITLLEQNTDIVSDNIFIRRNKTFTNEEYSLISNDSYNEAVNNLLLKYNIKDEDGLNWKYTSHQMRVRIATLMAENGFESQEIADFLNHSSISTIKKAYAFVRKKRMSELNTEFFQSHFKSIIPHLNIEKLTKTEREDLYVNLFINYRQMEYGKCIIPKYSKACGKLQESQNCASCQHLVTAVDYLYKWELFYSNQKERLDQLTAFYDEHNILIEEYSEYLEFKMEKMYLDSYSDVIKRIKEHNDSI